MRSRKNKILIVADGYPTDKNILTGIFVKQQVDIIRRLKPDWGVQVYFNPFFKIFSNTLVKKSFFWNTIKWSMQLLCFIPHLFKKYDLIHAHRFFFPAINAVSYKWFHNKTPLIITSHSIVQIEKRYDKPWVINMFNKFDKIIAVNHQMRKDFIYHFKLEPEKVVVRSCGLNFAEIEEIRRKNPKNENRSGLTLGFIGDYSDNKRPFLFLDCIKELKDQYNVKGIMIGGGQLQNKMEAYVKENKLPVEIHGTKEYSEVINAYDRFDIFVFPSASETFGITGIEALYCGVPVVSSDVGGKRDYIRHGENGYLFQKDDLKDLLQKIKLLINDPLQLEKLKMNASKGIDFYSNDLICQEIVNTYQDLTQS